MKKEIYIGNVGIGGKHPVSIQSMTSTRTSDPEKTLKQIEELYGAGCEIIRVAVPDQPSLISFKEIADNSPIPVIADIHFDYELAIGSIENGAKGIRINPGNIGSDIKVKKILDCARQNNIAIRIGVNSGSIEKKFIKPGISRVESMVESLLDKVRFCEKNNFDNIKLSIKSSDVRETVMAYRAIDKKCNYPLHLGVTETGTFLTGTIKSAIGIGSLLLDGIGNTIRVSLTDHPVNEIKPALEILKITGMREHGINLISCPTCARTSVELIEIVNTIEKNIKELNIKKNMKIAIMGCEVNGPGEAKDADIGIAFSKNFGYIFKKGKLIKKVEAKYAIKEFTDLVAQIS